MPPLTPSSVYRNWEVDGVPDSGKHEPKKAEIVQLLDQIQTAASAPAVVRLTKADLDLVTPADEAYGGQVLDDPDPSKNGYYYRSAAVWVRGRGFPDTFAQASFDGTANAQTMELASGVDPSSILVFFGIVATENTGPMTLDGVDVVNAAGNALTAGEWAGVVLFFVNDDGDYQLLIDAGAAASAAASATAAALSFTSFDTRYLGAKATDPTTDNAGDVLEAGALYFNTTDGKFRVWNGAAWQDQSLALNDGDVTEPKLAEGAVTDAKLKAGSNVERASYFCSV